MVTPLHWSRMCRCSVTAAADCSRRTFDKQLSCVPQLQLSAQLSGGSFPAAGGRAVRPLLRNHLITGLCGRGSSPSRASPCQVTRASLLCSSTLQTHCSSCVVVVVVAAVDAAQVVVLYRGHCPPPAPLHRAATGPIPTLVTQRCHALNIAPHMSHYTIVTRDMT